MSEEVKEVKVNLGSKDFYFTLLSLLKQGLNPAQISLKLGMSKQRLNWYISGLKRNGNIKKVAYGVWEVTEKEVKVEPKVACLNLGGTFTSLKSFKRGLESDSVRGHAFVFTLKLPFIAGWNCERRQAFLSKKGVSFWPIGLDKSSQGFFFKNFKVWLNNSSVNVYFPKWKSYFTDNSEESYNYALYDFRELVKGLESFFNCSFKIKGNYVFKVSRQHYALVKNSLAKQYNKTGEKLLVYDSNGLWFVIDNSLSLNEAETVNKDTSKPDNVKVQDFFNSVKATGMTLKDVQAYELEIKDRVVGLSKNLMDISLVLEQQTGILNKIVVKHE